MNLPLSPEKPGYLQGQLLVATPLLQESCFSRAVIFMFAHSAEGAMGIIVNHIIENIRYQDLFDKLSIKYKANQQLPVHFGGPVEIHRGFLLYPADQSPAYPDAIITSQNIAVSGSLSILQDIANDEGPKQCLLALGYAGWSAGQLEAEIEKNSWLTVPADRDLIFSEDNVGKWTRATQRHGIDLGRLSVDVGHA
jgi:putative transcriptional regulator